MEGIQISEKLISFFLFLPMFIISISVHEYAHALLAFKLGDHTAKNQGRLTLNPLKHIDLIGTIMMPVASFASGMALIGWAKPVPVNRNNFKNPLKHDALVSFAGPFSNFVLSIIFFLLFVFVHNNTGGGMLLNILWYGVFFNLFLGMFNLLPIPPLDGSHILYDLFPSRFTGAILKLGFYGTFLLLVFIYSPLWNYFFLGLRSILNFGLRTAGI